MVHRGLCYEQLRGGKFALTEQTQVGQGEKTQNMPIKWNIPMMGAVRQEVCYKRRRDDRQVEEVRQSLSEKAAE